MLSFPTITSAQATKAGVVTTLQGSATVARATATQPAPLRFKDDVFEQDHIVTGESSIVRILLGGKAVVTVRERSALTIHETPTTSTIEISSGKIALAVAKDRMKPGESVQIKTPNAMAGVRGTVVIADVAAPNQLGGAVTTRFTLLTGLVDVARLDGAGQPSGQVVMLHPLQSITVTGLMPPGAVRTLTRAEAQAVAADYKVTLPAPPPPANVQVTEQQIEIAVQHSVALTGGQSGNGVPTTERARNEQAESGETGSASPSSVTVGTGGTSGGGFGVNAGANLGSTASVNSGVSAGGGTVSASTTVAVGGGAVGAGLGVSVGGGGISAGTTVAVGGGAIGAGGSVTVGGGGIGAGLGAGVGGIGAGGGVSVGGGGVGVGGTVGAGGLGAGVGVGVGGGGVTGGVTVGGVGGVTVGGGGSTGTGGSGGGGLLGGLVPKVLPLK